MALDFSLSGLMNALDYPYRAVTDFAQGVGEGNFDKMLPGLIGGATALLAPTSLPVAILLGALQGGQLHDAGYDSGKFEKAGLGKAAHSLGLKQEDTDYHPMVEFLGQVGLNPLTYATGFSASKAMKGGGSSMTASPPNIPVNPVMQGGMPSSLSQMIKPVNPKILPGTNPVMQGGMPMSLSGMTKPLNATRSMSPPNIPVNPVMQGGMPSSLSQMVGRMNPPKVPVNPVSTNLRPLSLSQMTGPTASRPMNPVIKNSKVLQESEYLDELAKAGRTGGHQVDDHIRFAQENVAHIDRNLSAIGRPPVRPPELWGNARKAKSWSLQSDDQIGHIIERIESGYKSRNYNQILQGVHELGGTLRTSYKPFFVNNGQNVSALRQKLNNFFNTKKSSTAMTRKYGTEGPLQLSGTGKNRGWFDIGSGPDSLQNSIRRILEAYIGPLA